MTYCLINTLSSNKQQKINSKPAKSSSSGKNSDTSDKEQTTASEESSRKESMSGASKAALESFISHRSKSTDSTLVAASAAMAKAKVLSPKIKHTQPNWLEAPQQALPKNESQNALIIEEDKSDTISTGGDRHNITPDGRAVTESDDELADHVNLVVLGRLSVV